MKFPIALLIECFVEHCRIKVTPPINEIIPLFSFQVGDLVLIILDERHDNYVLFTVSPTLYFLHSESLPALDLKPGEGGKCHIGNQNNKPRVERIYERFFSHVV